MDKAKIKKLAIAEFKAKRVFDALGMRNIESDFDKRLEQYVEYEEAKTNWMKANRELMKAQHGL